MNPLGEIFYIYAVPEIDLAHGTQFQGFPVGMLKQIPFFPLPVPFPSNTNELSLSLADRCARRREGMAGFAWSIVTVESLLESTGPPPFAPLMVIFSARIGATEQLAEWSTKIPVPPLLVGLVKMHKSVIAFEDLSVQLLQKHCKSAVEAAAKLHTEIDYSDMLKAVDEWKFGTGAWSKKKKPNWPTAINESVLEGLGRQFAFDKDFKITNRAHVIEAITKSTEAVIQLQTDAADRGFYLFRPEHPDLILFAPAVYRGIYETLKKEKPPPEVLHAIKLLERQDHYSHELSQVPDSDDGGVIANVLYWRQNELHIQRQAVNLRGASTVAGVIEMPNRVNRIQGTIDVFGRHVRHYVDLNKKLPDNKTAKAFTAVQQALVRSIPEQHINLIAKSRIGIKIIGDAPLEWLPINGVPLGIWTDVSRISATPGHLLFDQLRTIAPQPVHVDQFREYLLISMFEDNEKSDFLMSKALESLAEKKNLKGRHIRPKSTVEFEEALKSYTGAILIIDCHGEHAPDSNLGGLYINGKLVNVRELFRNINMPPIVVLSACDMHPFDRSHETVANHFLQNGAISVLSTVLPIGFGNAAAFLMRLMLRAVQYGGDMNRRGISVPWSNIVGGALRQHLAHEIAMDLVERKVLALEVAKKIQEKAVNDINFPPRKDWLQLFGTRVIHAAGIDETRWQATLSDIIAASNAIRYVNLGNPESIILFDSVSVKQIRQRFQR